MHLPQSQACAPVWSKAERLGGDLGSWQLWDKLQQPPRIWSWVFWHLLFVWRLSEWAGFGERERQTATETERDTERDGMGVSSSTQGQPEAPNEHRSVSILLCLYPFIS